MTLLLLLLVDNSDATSVFGCCCRRFCTGAVLLSSVAAKQVVDAALLGKIGDRTGTTTTSIQSLTLLHRESVPTAFYCLAEEKRERQKRESG